MDTKHKALVASKLREYYKLPDASDDEIFQVYKELEAKDMSDDQIETELAKSYPDPNKKKESPLGAIVGSAAILGTGIAIGALTRGRGKLAKVTEKVEPTLPKIEVPRIEKVVEAPSAVKPKTEPVINPAEGVTPPIEQIDQLAKEPLPVQPKGSRILHAVGDEQVVEELRRIENDPVYKQALLDLGEGKVISHEETLRKAIGMNPMTVAEISSWTEGKPVHATDIVRANLLRSVYWGNYVKARFIEQDQALGDVIFNELLTQIEPGYKVLTATPGRSLEVMKLFKLVEEVSEKIDELRSINAPFSMIKTEADKLLKTVGEAEKPLGFHSIMRRKIEEYATAAKLTSPVTQAVNALSGGFNYITRGVEKHLGATYLDLEAKMNPALAPELRIEAEAMRKYAFGTGEGFIASVRQFLPGMEQLWRDVNAEQYGQELYKSGGRQVRRRGKAETPELPSLINYTLLKMSGKPVKFKDAKGPIPKKLRPLSPFRWMWAADQFWKRIIHNSELYIDAYTQAFQEAKIKGWTNEQALTRMKVLLEDTSTSWYKIANKRASEVAKEYAFQEDPDRILEPLVRLQNVPGVPLVIPFVQTPYNINKFHLQRSVFGALSRRNINAIKKGGRDRAEAIGRLGVGVGITAATVAAIQLGKFEISGAWPKNKKEAATWIEKGKRPWSIKIGDYWFAYNRFQPLGSYLTTIGAFTEAMKENKFDEAENKFTRALAQLMSGPFDMPFVQGMSSLFEAIQDPEMNLDDLGNLTAVGFIPNIVRDIRIQMDPIQRKPNNIEEALKNAIPGLSPYVPERVTLLGHTSKYPKELWRRSAKVFSQMTETEKTAFMDKIGWAPPIPNTRFKVVGPDGVMIEKKLEGDMKVEYLKRQGKIADMVIGKFLEHPDVDKMPLPILKRRLTNVVEQAQGALRNLYEAKSGMYPVDEQLKESMDKAETQLKETGL